MKLSIPINLKNTEFLQATPTLRSTWTFKLSSITLIGAMIIGPLDILYHWSRLPALVPLWYSRPWGEERLVPPIFLLLPLVVSVGIYLANILIAKRYAADHPMFSRVLFLTSSLVSIISAIIVMRVIALIT